MAMLFSDYHNHPQGHRDISYSQELLMPWVKEAEKKGITDLLLTDHDRYHKGVCLEEIDTLKKATITTGVNIKIGIELDNDPVSSKLGKRWTEKNWDRLDYVIGSVHYIEKWAFDNAHYKDEFDNWNIDKLYEKYFLLIQKTAISGLVDGIGHLDLIKIFGHRPKSNLKDLYGETLEIIKENNLAVEINMSGLRKPVKEQYPSLEILRMVKEMGISIVTSSDAHTYHDVACGYDVLEGIIKEVGFEKVAIYNKHQRQEIDLGKTIEAIS